MRGGQTNHLDYSALLGGDVSPKRSGLFVLVATVAGGTAGWLSTLPPPPSDAAFASQRELIIFQAEGCVYCRVFRREVLPEYAKVYGSGGMPIKFLDVNEIGSLESALASPLTIVPTAVIMAGGREVGRISGYTDKTVFLQMVSGFSDSH